jgi:predicted nuclease of predicted toxin-antitoxin system
VKLLLDQNRSWRLASLLTSIGYDALHVNELGLSTASDDAVLAAAEQSGRILISADTDFAALLALREATQPSVVLFRTRLRRTAQDQFNLLEDLLPMFEEDLAVGSVLVISDENVRVRRLPLLGD